MLCNDNKICEKNCLSYFDINESKTLTQFVVVILSVMPTVSSPAERPLSVLRRPKTN